MVAEGDEVAHEIGRVSIHILILIGIARVQGAEPGAARIARERIAVAERGIAAREHTGVVRRVVEHRGRLVLEGIGASVYLHVNVAEITVVLGCVMARHLLRDISLAPEVAHNDIVAYNKLVGGQIQRGHRETRALGIRNLRGRLFVGTLEVHIGVLARRDIQIVALDDRIAFAYRAIGRIGP